MCSIILAVYCSSSSKFFSLFLTSSFSFVTHRSSSKFFLLKVLGEILFYLYSLLIIFFVVFSL